MAMVAPVEVPMRFAVLHHLESAGDGETAADVYAEVAEQVRAAGDLGFDIAWVAEHHFSAAKGRAPAPLLFLVHLAGQTHRIRLGSAVLPAPFYHPLRLAESVAMADVLTGGRLACGISSSGVPDEMGVFGVAQEGKHERLRAALLWLKRAWAGEAVVLPPDWSAGTAGDHAGAPRMGETSPTTATASASIAGHDAEVSSLAGDGGPPGQPDAVGRGGLPDTAPARDVHIVPRPLQASGDMVWVAASSAGAARVAGELGHHLLLPSLRPLDASADNAAAYRAALSERDGTVTPRHVQSTMHLVLHEDHAAAMRLAEPVVRAYYERYVASGAVQRIADESLPAIMARINFAAGGPEAVAEQVTRVVDALALTHVAFQSRLIGVSHRQVLRGLELVMERVAPLVRPSVSLV